MQKRMKLLFVGMAVILMAGSIVACGPTYGHRYDRYDDSYRGNFYQEERRAFEYGYREGAEHGNSDSRSGHDFNYRHDRRYQDGISGNGRINDAFRDGYKRGYEAGYYGRSSYYRRY